MLMPDKHPVIDMLVLHFHEKEGHLGASHVLSVLNRQYWIIKGNSNSEKNFEDLHKLSVLEGRAWPTANA